MPKPKGKTRQKHNKKGKFWEKGGRGQWAGAPWGVFYIPSPAAITFLVLKLRRHVVVSTYRRKNLKKTTIQMPPPKKNAIKGYFTSI